MRIVFFAIIFIMSGVNCLPADDIASGDSAIADAAIAAQYLLWAEDAIVAGRWSQARAALERASDFADVSSDISYLLALACFHENESRSVVLQLLERAIRTERWVSYSEAQARLFAAEQLICLRRYSAALDTLAAISGADGGTIDIDLLRLAALKGRVNGGDTTLALFLDNATEFRRCMRETLDRYPRDPRPVRIFFSYARNRLPAGDDLALMELVMNRLPFLLDSDPELAWMAAPFIGEVAEARRLVAAYRAGSYNVPSSGFRPNPASIAVALNLGLLDDMDAIEELFAPGPAEAVLDKDLIVSVGDLLRSEEGRESFAERLHSFTGSITEDDDHDGYAESYAVYIQGILQGYYCDAEQNRRNSLSIRFSSGSPQWAELAAQPTARSDGGAESRPLGALIFWERYPSVQRAELGTETYLYAPKDFHVAPIRFMELGASNKYAGLLFPRRDSLYQGVNRHMLASFAVFVRRPSIEFAGGVEHVYLRQGIPLRAEDTVNGVTVSITEFENGRPLVRRMDLDLDGRMETIHHFRWSGLGSSESDWSGSGAFVTAELYREDGSVVYSWDLDGDGIREYKLEMRNEKRE